MPIQWSAWYVLTGENVQDTLGETKKKPLDNM